MHITVTPDQWHNHRTYVKTSSILIMGCGVLFFAMFDGFVRFGPIAPMIWLMAYACVAMAFIASPQRAISIMLRHWPIFLLPLFAILSTIWTSAPTRTPIAGFQLFMTTLIAVMIANHLTTRQLMLALLLGQACGFLLSLLNIMALIIPATSPVNGSLIGIYGHKTAFGYSAVLSSFALMAWLSYYGKEAWALLFAILVTPIVLNTQSATAIGSFSIVFVLFFILRLRRISPVPARRILLLVTTFFGTSVVLLTALSQTLSSTVLSALGKSTTLTGRTELWQIAIDIWRDAPILGVGFSAFWHSAEHAISVSFIHVYVDDRLDGFHNAFLECLVAMGAIGVFILLLNMLISTLRLCALTFLHLSHDAMIWLCVLLCYVLVAMMIQDVGFKQHSGSYMMMVFCYIYAMPLNRRA
jgi:exopolysaccharide production protein ExoQ